MRSVLAASALLILLAGGAYGWANLRPSLSPSDVRFSAVLRPPDRRISPAPAFLRSYWTLDVTVRMRGMIPKWGFPSPYAEVDAVLPQTGAPRGRPAGERDDCLGQRPAWSGQRRPGGDPGFSYAGDRYPLKFRCFVRPKYLPYLHAGVIVYAYRESRMGRDLSWWKAVPVKVLDSPSNPAEVFPWRIRQAEGR